MSKPDFSALLGKRIEDAKPPITLPPGVWLASVGGHKMVESGVKKTPGVEVEFAIQAPEGDVDLSAFPDEDFAGKRIRETFWLTENSDYRLADFLKMVPAADGTETFAEGLVAVEGASIRLNITNRPLPPREGDPEDAPIRMIAEINSFAKAD